MENQAMFEHDNGFFFIKDIQRVNIVEFEDGYLVEIDVNYGMYGRQISIDTDTKEAAYDIMATLKTAVKALVS